MSLYDHVSNSFVDPVLNWADVEQFSINYEDSLDVRQSLNRLSRSETFGADLWKPKGLDPYGDAVAQLGDKVGSGSRDFLVKAGKIPLGIAEIDVDKPDGSLNRTADFTFNWKNTDFDSIENRVTEMVEDSNVKIPEKLAKYAGASQVKAGGEFEVDRDINDFDDALRAFGITNVTFREATQVTDSNTGNNAMDKSTFLNKKTLAVAGAAAAVGFIVIKK